MYVVVPEKVCLIARGSSVQGMRPQCDAVENIDALQGPRNVTKRGLRRCSINPKVE